MMKFLIVLVLSLVSGNLFAHRENTYYLYGNFGDTKVGVVIDEFGDVCYARYFDVNDKYDRVLEGKINSELVFEMYSYKWDTVKKAKVSVAKLVIREVENYAWLGTWTAKDGVIQTVKLQPIIADSLNHPCKNLFAEMRIDPYMAYRTSNVYFVNNERQRVGKGIDVQWMTDEMTGIKMFRLIANKKYRINIDSVNNVLAAEHLKYIDSKLSCVNIYSNSNYELKCSVHYANAKILCYQTETVSNCYGGGKERILINNNRSITSGKLLRLDDVIWFGDKNKLPVREGSNEWYQYRYKVFGPKIHQLLLQQYADRFASDSASCHLNDLNMWQFPSTWYVNKQGLFIGGQMPVQTSPCHDSSWSILPWKSIKPYVIGDFDLVK